ncbi:hypothetical protein PVK06_005563 [Gossypium arboreum]|uniref:Putative plant transposon protein domain-containing protein n=1 Tax=Gossypium arboreum TaxID=29729 RepID=A0ABR0QVW4_GOSAR|nr:hypothetical protein PVK06_005563 [Gossypium arboreum]
MGYTEAISSVVEKYGWGIFCLYLGYVFPKVVKEFYVHITSFESAFIYVCGTSALFDEDSINAQYGSFEGIQCSISRNDCYTIDRVLLKTQCKIWYNFLKTRLIPYTHNTTISKDQLLLLHSIIMGRKISVGNIIFREIHCCAQKNASRLNFPSLIIALYQRVKVALSPNEDRLPNKGAITMHIVQKLAGEEMPRQTGMPLYSPPWTTSAVPQLPILILSSK